MATIDTLDIQIKADAQKATSAIDRLVTSLEKLSSALTASYGANLSSLATGVEQLGLAMATFKQNASTQTFNSLANNLNRINSVNTNNMGGLAAAVTQLNNALGALTQVSANAESVRGLANALARLGSKSISNAVINIPQLENALMQLMASLSKAPTVSNNVLRLVESLGQLSHSGNGIQSASRQTARGLNSMAKSSDKARKKYAGLASTIGRFYATYFLAIRGIKKLNDAIQGSMDYVETYNYFSVTMDKIGKEYSNMYERFGYDSAEKYAESFTNRMNDLTRKMTGYKVGNNGQLDLTDTVGLGLDPNQLMQFEAKVNAVTNSVGLIGETSINTAKAVSMLSADLSSLTNTNLDTVMTNLSSGLIGQSRALYKYGIDITNATLQTYAYQYGITKATNEMTQSEKMQLRLLAILDQSRVAWGDQANTINSVANQYRILSQQFNNLSRTIGNLFLPIIQKALPIINGMIVALNRLFTSLGFSLWGDNWLKQLQDGISGGVGDNLEDLGEEAENTAEKVKKLNDNLQGFDEINKLSEDTDADLGNLGDASGVIDLSKEIADALNNYESVWEKALSGSENKINAFADKFERLLEPIKQTFLDLFNGDYYATGQDVGGLAMNIFNYFSDAIGNVKWDKIGKNIADYWNGVFSKISGKDIARGINNFTNAMWDTIVGFIKEFDFKQIAKIIGNLLANLDYSVLLKLGALKMATGLITTFANSLKTGFIKTVTPILTGSAMSQTATGWGSKLGGWISTGLKSPLMTIPAVVGSVLITVSDHYAEIAKGFENTRGKIGEETKKIIKSAEDTISNVTNMFKAVNADYIDAGKSTNVIETLADKYLDLAENIGDSKENLELLESYKQALIDEGGEEFEKIVNNTTLSYEQQKKAIDDLIGSLKKKAYQEAASASISQIASQQIPLQSTIDELTDQEAAAKAKLDKANQEWLEGYNKLEQIMKYYDNAGGFRDAFEEMGMSGEELHQAFRKLQPIYSNIAFNDNLPKNLRLSDKELVNAINSTNSFWKKTQDAEAEWNAVNQQLKVSQSTMKELETELDYYTGIASGAIDTTTSLYEYQKKKADEAKQAEKERADSMKLTYEKATTAIESSFSNVFGKDSKASKTVSTFFNDVDNKLKTTLEKFRTANPILKLQLDLDTSKIALPELKIQTASTIASPTMNALLNGTQSSNNYGDFNKYLNVNVSLEGDVSNLFKVNSKYVTQTGINY